MVKTDYHIIHESTIYVDGGTIIIENDMGKNAIPVENVRSIYAHKPVSISSGVVSIISRLGIPVHFFNWYGNYEATLWPKTKDISGDVIIKQAEKYLNTNERINIAKSFVSGALHNFNRILSEYDNEAVKKSREDIKYNIDSLDNAKDINEIMGIEGRSHNSYFTAIDSVIPEKFRINKRTRRPPTNMGNALISFGNSMVYASVLTEIYFTHLNPTISYLHEPSERRFSLSLDIAEIFKLIISHKLLLYLINKKVINENDFDNSLEKVILNEKGKKLYLKNYEEKLTSTVFHRTLKRNVTYQDLIRMEVYKLEKHLLGIKPYTPFIMWW